MKKLYFTFALALAAFFTASAQVALFPQNADGVVEYQAVVNAKGSKDQLYTMAKQWVAKTFNNPTDVMKMDDPASGIIKVTYVNPFIENETLSVSLEIELKDGKYRYTFNNIFMPTEASVQDNMTAEGVNRRIKEKTDKGKKPMKFLTEAVIAGDAEIKAMIASLDKSMQSPDSF